jgi:hypothetical protein
MQSPQRRAFRRLAKRRAVQLQAAIAGLAQGDAADRRVVRLLEQRLNARALAQAQRGLKGPSWWQRFVRFRWLLAVVVGVTVGFVLRHHGAR